LLEPGESPEYSRLRVASPVWKAPAAGALAFLAILLGSGLIATKYNNYVLLADAFLHGRVWIDEPQAGIDALAFGGRYYIIEAPLPAVLLLPFVAIWGFAANQSLLAAALGGIAIGAAWTIGSRLGLSDATNAWLCGFMLLGTDLYWCAMLGDVWFIAHVAAVAFTLLALAELLGRRRAWIVALCAVAAFESRFVLVMAVPVYALLLALDRASNEERRKVLVSFALTLLPFAFLWVGYNEARWGLPYDIGYSNWYHQDPIGERTGSPFQLQYVKFELYSFFVLLPAFFPKWPYVVPTILGIALTWTSPGLALAFLARAPRPLVLALWAVTLAIFIASILYYANGATQFGMRHALDFEPFLLVLMALGVRRGMPAWGAVACGYSIAFGVWGAWFWRTFFRY
jgi:hypothetical protein